MHWTGVGPKGQHSLEGYNLKGTRLDEMNFEIERRLESVTERTRSRFP